MTGKIYKIVNDINDKVYVGQTIRTLKVRFQRHCNFSKVLKENGIKVHKNRRALIA